MNRSIKSLSILMASAIFGVSACDSKSTPVSEDVTVLADSLPAPVINPSGGTYSSVQLVTIIALDSNSIIYYSTDGSDPSDESMKYESPVTIRSSQILKAAAFPVNVAKERSHVSVARFKIPGGLEEPDTTIPWNRSISFGSLTDGGQTYKTVKIGGQTWMAENLNYSGEDGAVGVCRSNSNDHCRKYGRFYSWSEMTNGRSNVSTTQGGRRDICPTGWHVPIDQEWAALERSIAGTTPASVALKVEGGWPFCGTFCKEYEYLHGTDSYGFRALPAGANDRFGGDSWPLSAEFWSATVEDSNKVCVYQLSPDSADLIRTCFLDPGYRYRYSVRCVQDSSGS